MNIKSNIWFENDNNGFFGKGRIELLEQIAISGSISAAAKAMKMSYKAAWDAVNEMNNLSSTPIVKRETGGKGGGGTVLTENGRATIALYKELEKMQAYFLDTINTVSSDAQTLQKFSKKLMLRTSARNQLLGIVEEIETTNLGANIILKLSGGERVNVFITRRSFDEMAITLGRELFIILKSSWLTLSTESLDSCSNNLACTIHKISQDVNMVELEVSLLGGNTLTLTLHKEKFEKMQIKQNDKAFVCFEASNAILAI